jgi:asparagine synthase (glutamine-hydrolysing)
MKVLDEKYLLKRCAEGLVPPSVRKRPKQPYRAPDGKCFFGGPRPEYVDMLLSPRRVEQDGIFNPFAVQKLVGKFRQGRAIGIKDNMALVGVLSTQVVVDQFVRNSGMEAPRVEHRAAATAICR